MDPVKKLQLVVQYLGHRTRYYPIDQLQSWKIDADQRLIVIGKGVPRTFIPLDSIEFFRIEEC